MASKKIDFKRVGIALLVALVVSITIVVVGRLANLSDSVVDVVSAVAFFSIFLAVCNVRRRDTAR